MPVKIVLEASDEGGYTAYVLFPPGCINSVIQVDQVDQGKDYSGIPSVFVR